MSDQLEQDKIAAPRRLRWCSRPAVAGAASVAALAIIVGAVRAPGDRNIAGDAKAPSAISAPGTAPKSEPATSSNQAAQLPSFADLAHQVTPAVVSVYVSAEMQGIAGEPGQREDILPPGLPFRFFFREFGRSELEARPHLVQAQGSGFFISSDGYVLTNNHVVDHAESVKVKTVEGKTYPAKVVGTDAQTDLALLKVDGAATFPSVTFADRPPRIGDWVLAVGNPFGLGGTVTAGIVSAAGRDIGSGPHDFLQIDAPVNKGNSGGPAFNLQGQVVGINTAIYSPSGGSVGIAFDIPAETAKTVAAQLQSKGVVTRGWIGVSVRPVTQEVADSLDLKQATGALVADVASGGPAAKAGIKTGDAILSLDGTTIADSRDLARKVAAENAGKAVTLRIWRDGSEQTIGLNIVAQPSEPSSQAMQAEQGQRKLGLALAPAARVAGAGSKGVAVLSVDPGGTAAEKGIQPGDVILQVGGKRVSTPREVENNVEAAANAGGHAVLLRVKSGGGTRFVALPVRQG
jgi:serine protease Do